MIATVDRSRALPAMASAPVSRVRRSSGKSTVPEEESHEIRAHAFGSPRGFGSVKVEARIGDVTWRTSVFPLNSGGYLLPVKKEVRSRAGLSPGDEVTVQVELL